MSEDIGSMGAAIVASIHETSVAAVAAQAKATVEARYIVAHGRPRDMDDARVRILAECKRPRFAEVARYSKPIGGTRVAGPSIRFVEGALRCMGNVDIQTPTVYDDAEKRIIRVSVTDLETNATYSSDITMAKTVERASVKAGQEVVGKRENSRGQTTYIVRATEDDLIVKQAALVSKAIRTNGLRILPGDIVEEAMDEVMKTLETRDSRDPNEARKRIVDGFASIGVQPSSLKAYLDHDIGEASPAELADLRAVFAAIRDGETTWHEVARQRDEARKKAPDRAASMIDAKDEEKIVAVVKKRAESFGGSIAGYEILRDLLARYEIATLDDLPKSDLPAFLKAASTWDPPVTAEPAAEGQESLV